MNDQEVTIMVDFREPGLKKTGIMDTDAKIAIEKALDAFRWVAAKSRDAVREVSSGTDQIEVEFGIKVGSKAGVLVAQGHADAHITAKLIWSKRHSEQPENQGA